jgi:hypothetical protein
MVCGSRITAYYVRIVGKFSLASQRFGCNRDSWMGRLVEKYISVEMEVCEVED